MNMSRKHKKAVAMRIWQINMSAHLTKRLYDNAVMNNMTPYELNYLLNDDWKLFRGFNKKITEGRIVDR